MEKIDKIFSFVIFFLFGAISYCFNLDFYAIADSGLTLSSIVIAVYIAAIIGLINTELSKKMSSSVSPQDRSKSQLGVLVIYFKIAIGYAITTIILSSIILLIHIPDSNPTKFYSIVSVLGFIAFSENIYFLIVTIRFMLNRQIWNQ